MIMIVVVIVVYMFKKIINLDIVKEAYAFFPFFFHTYTFPFKLRNVLLCDKINEISFLIPSKYSAALSGYIFFCICSIQQLR